MALQLVNAGLVQFTGTDAHHQRHLDVLCRPLPDASVLTKLSGGVIKMNCYNQNIVILKNTLTVRIKAAFFKLNT